MAPRADTGVSNPEALRRRAEALIQDRASDLAAISPEEIRRLVHELEVHQIELEMQNEELREAQQELEASRDRYVHLYDFAPVGYATLDGNGLILEINLAATKLLDRPRDGLVRRPLANCLHVADRGAFRSDIWKCVEENAETTCEARVNASDLVVEFHTVPVDDPECGKARCRTAIIDITRRRGAEEERAALVAQLELKNGQLEQFTHTVSHDLKSPLITVRGFLDVLRQNFEEGNLEAARDSISLVMKATDQMHALLTKLLVLSRAGTLIGELRDVSMESVAHDVVESLGGVASEKGVRVTIAPGLPVVHGDRLRLREVLQNLVENAVKYMGDQSGPRIEIGVRRNETGTTCFVRDNGMGIAPVHQEQVFGMFGKVDADSEGTGLGLALAQRIVEAHGGRIWVESAGIGEGCVVCFTIPPKKEAKES